MNIPYKHKILALFTVMTLATAWNEQIHKAICLLALDSADQVIIDDLSQRLRYFSDVPSINTICDLAASTKFAQDTLKFTLFQGTDEGKVFTAKVRSTGEEVYNSMHTPLVHTITLLNNFLTAPTDERSAFWDTFALVHSIRLWGDLFQPLKTFAENGFDIPVKNFDNLHTYWDSLCGEANSMSAEDLFNLFKKAKETKTIAFQPGKEIPLKLDTWRFTGTYDLEYVIHNIESIFTSRSTAPNTEGQDVYQVITNKDYIQNSFDDYHKLCINVSVCHIIYSSIAIQNFLKKVYRNLGTAEGNKLQKFTNNLGMFTSKPSTTGSVKRTLGRGMEIKTLVIVCGCLVSAVLAGLVFWK